MEMSPITFSDSRQLRRIYKNNCETTFIQIKLLKERINTCKYDNFMPFWITEHFKSMQQQRIVQSINAMHNN